MDLFDFWANLDSSFHHLERLNPNFQPFSLDYSDFHLNLFTQFGVCFWYWSILYYLLILKIQSLLFQFFWLRTFHYRFRFTRFSFRHFCVLLPNWSVSVLVFAWVLSQVFRKEHLVFFYYLPHLKSFEGIICVGAN